MPQSTPEARAAYNRQYYADHRSELGIRAAAWKRARRDEALDYLHALKAATPCADCAQRYPAIVMDFDHVRDQKIMAVSAMAANARPLAEIKAEVAKCEIVCANCHRLRTAHQLGLRGT